MDRLPCAASRRTEGGFTTTEIVVVVAVITVMSAAALNFFLGHHELARRQVVLGHFAEAIQNVRHLPEGNLLSWQATAQVLIAGVMDADPPTTVPAPGTLANMLPNGLHAGRTLVNDESLMLDRRGNAVTLSGCAVGDLQITLDARSLPRQNVLRKADIAWMKSSLETMNPELIIRDVRRSLFFCLPGS